MNITKNQVSYFIAGYKAGLVRSGTMSSEEIEHEDYTTITFRNEVLKYLRAYNSEEFDKQGLEAMYKELK